MESFEIPLKNADGTLSGKKQEVKIFESTNDDLFDFVISKNGVHFGIDLKNKNLHIAFVDEQGAENVRVNFESLNVFEKYKNSLGKYNIPINSVKMDAQENITFDIDGNTHTFNIGANDFSVKERGEGKTPVQVCALKDAFDILLNQRVLENLTFSNSETLPSVNCTGLPTQIFDILEESDKIKKLDAQGVRVIKINGTFLLEKGSKFFPLPVLKDNKAPFYAGKIQNKRGKEGYKLNFVIKTERGKITGATSPKKMFDEETLNKFKDFFGTDSVLSKEDFEKQVIQTTTRGKPTETTKKLVAEMPFDEGVGFVPNGNHDDGNNINNDENNNAVKKSKDEDVASGNTGLVPISHEDGTGIVKEKSEEDNEERTVENAPAGRVAESGNSGNTGVVSEEKEEKRTESDSPIARGKEPDKNNAGDANKTSSTKKASLTKDEKKAISKFAGDVGQLIGVALIIAGVATGLLLLVILGFCAQSSGFLVDSVQDLMEISALSKKNKQNLKLAELKEENRTLKEEMQQRQTPAIEREISEGLDFSDDLPDKARQAKSKTSSSNTEMEL